MVGGIDRYAGVTAHGNVKLDKNDAVTQKGTSFYGKLVGWMNGSNQRVRQDFVATLKTHNKEVFRKYEHQLVGAKVDKKPLKGALVEQIMKDVAAADVDPTIGPKRDRSQPTLVNNIVKSATSKSPGKDEIALRLRDALEPFAKRHGSYANGKAELAKALSAEYATLGSDQERSQFEATLGKPSELVDNIDKLTKTANAPREDGYSAIRFHPNVVTKPEKHEPDPQAVPGKSILKKPAGAVGAGPIDLTPETELSKLRDKALAPSEKHFPQPFLDLLKEFNANLPPEKQITLADVMGHRSMDLEYLVTEKVNTLSKGGTKPVSEDALNKGVSESIKIALSKSELQSELQRISKDGILSDQAKAEAAHRLVHELGPDIAQIKKHSSITQRTLQLNELFAQNRSDAALWDVMEDISKLDRT